MKKRIIYMILSICIMLASGGCTSGESKPIINDEDMVTSEDYNNDEKKEGIEKEVIKNRLDDKKLEEDTKEVKTIVIDPGHSSVGNSQKEPISPGSNETKAKDVLGATGSYSGIPEYETTVSVGLLLRDELISRGYNVVMTKTDISQSLSNVDRANIGNENNADLAIRIHTDSSENHSIKGASALVPEKNQYTDSIYEPSINYGEKIINSYTRELNINNRGTVIRGDMTGFNWSKVPVVIIEMGFISNEQEDRFISNTENHRQISKAIANSIDKCFE